MTTWLYIAACVIVPILWGGLSAWMFSRVDRRRRESTPERPPIDYMI